MRTKRKTINLFEDKNIFTVKYVVSIDDEEDLNQFWDFLINSNNSAHEIINTFITQFYNFALSYLINNDAEFFEIILEENEKYFYFTLWNKKIALLFKKYIKNTSLKYIYDKNRISIKLAKKEYKSKLEIIKNKNKKREQNLINSVTNKHKIKKLKPYTFLEDDDLQELIKLNENLQDLMYQANKYGFNENMFISFRSTFSIFCLTLRYYDEISPITTTITNFSNFLNMNKDKFIDLDSSKLELVSGFIYNIEKWLQTLFVTGGADIHFMDNSIKADYNIIVQFISENHYGKAAYDLDELFIF